MDILVIGGGAIGCFLAARLQRAGQQVVLAARPHTATAIRTQGLRWEEPGKGVLNISLEAAPGVAAALAEGRRYDLVILAVKAYHTAAAAAELRQAAAAPLPIVSMQNGVGNEEILADQLPNSPVYAGAITTPVEVLGPGEIRVARPSFRVAFAPFQARDDVSALAQTFVAAGFRTQVFPDYRALKWTKLLMNILANVQSAILSYTPAQIFAQPALGNLEVRAWREALAVMRGLGVRPVNLAGYPLGLVSPLLEKLPLAVVRPVLGRLITGGRGSKMPSLYHDLHPHRKSRSEVRWLNGAVHHQGLKLGIATPVNSVFYQLMQRLLAGEEDVSAWAGRPERLLAAVAAAERPQNALRNADD